MIVNYTAEEQAKWEALEDKYEKLINEINEQIRGNATAESYKEKEKEILKRRSLAEPLQLHPLPKEYDENNNPVYDEKELEQYYNSEEYKAYKKALEDTRKELTEFYRSFTSYSENEFTELKRKRAALIDEHARARQQLYEECELRQFNELGGDPVKIIEDAKSQVEQVINNRYIAAIKYKEEGAVFSERYLRVDGDKLLIDTDSMIEDCRSILSLHYKALEEDQEATEALIESISDVIINNPYTGDTGTLGGFVNDHSKNKKTYRTKAKAKEHGDLTEMPKDYAIPTFRGYEASVNFTVDDKAKAHLMKPLDQEVTLRFSNGNIFIDNGNGELREISEMELENLTTKERIDYIDLPTLMVFYNIILNDFKKSGFKTLKDKYTIHIPELFSYLGIDQRINQKNIDRVKRLVESYHNMIGVYYSEDGRRNREPVLIFMGDSDEYNTISFGSPYLNHVIEAICKDAIRRNKKGIVETQSNGIPLFEANHSYLIKPEIHNEKNKIAIKNVEIIITGIEQAGRKGYHVSGKTILERNMQLAERLKSDPQHAAQFLKRVFKKTWELLETKTRLKDYYIDIELPDPNDPKVIPTLKGLEDFTVEISHKGKCKN